MNLPQSQKRNRARKFLLTAVVVCFVLTVLAAEQQSYGQHITVIL